MTIPGEVNQRIEVETFHLSYLVNRAIALLYRYERLDKSCGGRKR